MAGEPRQITGVHASVRWQYFVAAQLRGYVVTFDQAAKQWSVVATVAESDAFAMTQTPLLFIAPFQQGEWRWPITRASITNRRLFAELGPPQEFSRPPAPPTNHRRQ
jgi:hypothetical protein